MSAVAALASQPFSKTLATGVGIPLTVALLAAAILGGLRFMRTAMRRQTSQDALLAHIVAELSPNHGESMKDQMSRIEVQARANGEATAEVGRRLDAHLLDARQNLGRLDEELREARRKTD